MHIHAALVAARALIDTPDKWAQGTYARDRLGNGVSSTSDEACCRCAEGAVCAALGLPTPRIGVQPEEDVDASLAFGFLRASATLMMRREGIEPRRLFHPDVDLNDGNVRLPGLTAHEATLAMFDGAISNALEARV